MENKLSRLFDYQKFAPNSRLESIIKDVESRYSLDQELMSDDELDMVNAAGNINAGNADMMSGTIKDIGEIPSEGPFA